jgi:hypothetical protein
MNVPALLGCGVLLAGLAIGPGVAGEQTVASVPEILQVQHALRAKLDTPGGDYAHLDKSALQQIETAQDRVFQLLDGVTSLDQLNDQQKVDLSNALQGIQATLFAQDGSRVVCHVERKTGTHLTSRRCESIADRDRNAADAQKYMLDHPDHVQQPEQGH